MSENIKYKTTGPAGFDVHDVDEPISDFIFHRAGTSGLSKLVELLVERGVLSRREVFDTFKRTEDYLG